MIDMLVRLYDLPPIESLVEELKEKGVIIRQAWAFDKHQVINWVRDMFGEGWASECDVAFSNHPVSCFIALADGEIIGFACYDCTCKDFLGPMGVDENRQGLGLGKVLLLSALHAMKANGYAYAIIGGVGPQEFYAKVAGATPIEGSSPGIYRDMIRN